MCTEGKTWKLYEVFIEISMSDTIGPQIPHKPTNSYEDDDTDVIGPALPPGFSAKPPAARAVLTTPKEDQHNVPLSSQAIVGPCLPPTSGSRPGDVQTALGECVSRGQCVVVDSICSSIHD